ncbi:tumor necrosis factor receptor superfamily member 10D-like isoform X2 [Saimiri boliviensis]|uniref:tumor necrosis factor receptor superfamily member 10D-like isoform X2 n=1 Tax=Saimiri boliviensis TaxID=27679 RepID=UPI000533D617|nr:tumor necrosis factor receptor superfamily member 10D-like isoform X2 [Saimiri boliviensis boliviensis]
MAPGKTLPLVIFLFEVQRLVQGAPATITLQDEIPRQTVTPQQQRPSLKGECPPGSHRSPYTGDCIRCTEGVDYTNNSNNLPSCLLCTVCKSGQDMKSPCTMTTDTVCQCKEGTFQNENFTEMCQECSTGCPRGMVKVRDCTPWSDIECVDESAAEETVTSSPGTPASPFPTTVIILVLILLFILVVAGVVRKASLWKKVLPCLKGICSGAGGDREHVDRVFFWRSHPSRGPEDEVNACNETLSNRDLQPTQALEQEIKGQELAELTGVTVQSPEETQHLLGQAEAEGCQRRRLQVPVNDADPTEINTLLDASATPEEGRAKETIQD